MLKFARFVMLKRLHSTTARCKDLHALSIMRAVVTKLSSLPLVGLRRSVVTTDVPRYVGMPVLCAMLGVAGSLARVQQAPAPFHLQEATIAGIHDAFAAGQLTCARLTRLYLDRIEAYNLRGPALHAVIAVNPKSMETAAEMDRRYKANPSGAGPLHCVPIILKDNFNTFDMPTTGGNAGMRSSQPPADAFTVARMRTAGALIQGPDVEPRQVAARRRDEDRGAQS